jgi:exodeoxyribonuclease V alpha subunit
MASQERRRGFSARGGVDGEEVLHGVVQRVRFTNEDTHYAVADVAVAAATQLGAYASLLDAGARPAGRPVTVQGYFLDLREGDELRLYGRWVTHPRYGLQFEVLRYERPLPSTPRGVAAYLGSGLIRGVGPRTAEKLVERFGADALRVVAEEPERMATIPGIGKKRAERIAGAVRAQRAMEETMVFLLGFGIPPHLAARIYRQYGPQSPDIVTSNPYRLTDEMFGVGFLTADRIALATGVEPHSPPRLCAGVRHALTEAAAAQGHVFLPRGELQQRAAAVLSAAPARLQAAGATAPDAPATPAAAAGEAQPLDLDALADAIMSMCREGDLCEDGDAIYLPHLHRAECGVAEALQRLAAAPANAVPGAGVEEALVAAEAALGIRYAPEQREAIRRAVVENVAVITGGPGTGKTTVVRGVIAALRATNPRLRVLLAAPTGRAAKRLAEATSQEASTIHRLLGYRFTGHGWTFERDESNPLEGDLLIVDEFSMVDIILAWDLLRAVPPGMRLIAVGDADQLPPVGPGSVLRELIAAGTLAVVRLVHIFRQGEGSGIVAAAHTVREGHLPPTPPAPPAHAAPDRVAAQALAAGQDFVLVEAPDPAAAAAVIVELCRDLMRGRPKDAVQVLSPMYRGPAGVDALNAALQEALNPALPGTPELRQATRCFRTGDKVMQVRNNYEKDVFNGDIGTVSWIAGPAQDDEDEDESGEDGPSGPGGPRGRAGAARLLVDFYGRVVPYAADDIDELALAYAVTVHKAQGSEFPVVVMPVVSQHYIMLRRNLIYTAMSRARQRMIIVGSRRALHLGVRNNQVERRYAQLQVRLRAP